jgi:aminoglycoside phosphotransferase (APT) family kinase protein
VTDTEIDPAGMERLVAWLDEFAPELGSEPLRTSVITGGSTNLILSIDRGGPTVILRSPPIKAPSPQGAKTIAREAKVLKALAGSDVPHPSFHIYCADDAIIGVPFYIMDAVDGWAANISTSNVTTFDPPFDEGPDHHYLGYAMVDGLAAMANADYLALGLADFGKPEGFLERQPDRWLGQIASYPKRYPKYEPRNLEGLTYTADWLRDNIPSTSRTGLMHGDYALNNVLFARRPPTRLIAILDWETATIGDPLLDLAAFAQSLADDDGAVPGSSYFDATKFPRRSDVLAYYGELTGMDLTYFDYYRVLCRFRSSAMIEYKVAESIQGLSSPEKGDRFDKLVRGGFIAAAELARSLG